MRTSISATPTASSYPSTGSAELAQSGTLQAGTVEDRHLYALSEVSKLRRQAIPVDELLPKIVKAARRATGAKYAAMGVLTSNVHEADPCETRDHIVQFIHDGMDDETAAVIGPHPVGRGLLGKTIFEEQTVVAHERASHPDAITLPEGHPEMSNFLGAPLEVDGRVFGNLYLAEKPEGFSEEDRKVLEILCTQAGAAIQTSILAERLRGVLLSDERSRIARDMHDGVMQNLFSLGMTLDMLAQNAAETSPSLANDLQHLVDQVDDAIRSIRATIYRLRDSETDLDRMTLQDAVVTLAREYECSTGVRPSIAISAQVSASVPDQAVPDVVYLIKEALHNVRRHAKASQVSVSGMYGQGQIDIAIEDNGCGFDQSNPSVGHGLENMYERAKLIGGQLRITSNPGSGTSVFLTIPSQTTKEQL